jgi:hypothetical protein
VKPGLAKPCPPQQSLNQSQGPVMPNIEINFIAIGIAVVVNFFIGFL